MMEYAVEYLHFKSYSTTKDKLRSLFGEFGEIENIKVIKDRSSNNQKGTALLECQATPKPIKQ